MSDGSSSEPLLGARKGCQYKAPLGVLAFLIISGQFGSSRKCDVVEQGKISGSPKWVEYFGLQGLERFGMIVSSVSCHF
jgi:hypothetical protein